MPRMTLRVVWGLSVTIEIFSPTRLFSSVDFPELGRPRMETKPDLINDGSINPSCAAARERAYANDALACDRHRALRFESPDDRSSHRMREVVQTARPQPRQQWCIRCLRQAASPACPAEC